MPFVVFFADSYQRVYQSLSSGKKKKLNVDFQIAEATAELRQQSLSTYLKTEFFRELCKKKEKIT